MQTITTETTVCSFDELDEDTQERAAELLSATDDWYFFNESMTEVFTEYWMPEKFEPFGFYVDKKTLEWNEYNASFHGTVDLAEWLKANKLANKYRALYDAARGASRFTAEVRQVSYYGDNEYLIGVDGDDVYFVLYSEDGKSRLGFGYEACDTSPILQQAKEVKELLNDWIIDKWGEFSSMLRQEAEYRSSVEYWCDMAEMNEWLFDEDGNLH